MYQTTSNITSKYCQETHYNYVKNSGFWLSTFTGKERDSETGFSYFGARYYDSDLMTGWLSVDPLADKYPGLSPYAYCAWNPVKLVDPDGEELDIPDITQNNRKQTQDDILSLVQKENRNRILFDKNGSIKLDLDGLNKSQIENDKGLCLLSDLINSTKKYYYETNDQISCEIMYDGYPTSMDGIRHGTVNASNNGLDSENRITYKPKSGYDGHVILAQSGRWTDNAGNNARPSLLFHELSENYYRTEMGIKYKCTLFKKGAHQRAVEREGNYYSNPNPGEFHLQQYFPNSKATYYYKGSRVW